MKREFHSCLILGGLFFFLGLIGIGITFHFGFIDLDLDNLLRMVSIWAVLCSYIAYKKNRSPSSAFFVGLVFGPLGILYYLIARSGMSEKEKELYEWEIQKKYQKMIKERAKQ